MKPSGIRHLSKVGQENNQWQSNTRQKGFIEVS